MLMKRGHMYLINMSCIFCRSIPSERTEKENRFPSQTLDNMSGPPVVPTNEDLDDTIAQLNVRKRVPITSKSPDDTDFSLNQTVNESLENRPVSLKNL